MDKTKTSVLQEVLEEIRLLRVELSLFLPAEKLESYANSKKVVSSYRKALTKHPVSPVWK